MKDPAPSAASPRYTLDQLCALAGLPRRTVRYYIQIGLLDRPTGETRAAHYGPGHLSQLLEIRKWTLAGLSLERIRELLLGAAPPVAARPQRPGSLRVQSHLVVADGIEIVLDPERAGLSPAQVRAFLEGALALHRTLHEHED